jgi:hypothetical protein
MAFMKGRVWTHRRLRRLAGFAAGALLVTGCAGLEQPDVEQVATAFAAGDPSARCELLAPATLATLEVEEAAACAQTIGELAPSGGQVVHTEVWGGEAQVRLADDTMFLTRTDAGWRVAAAGCTPAGDAPYRCRVEGP